MRTTMPTIDPDSPRFNAAERAPVVFVKAGAVFTTSRDVAEVFGKDHRHVLEAIDNLLKSLMAEKSAMWFSAISEPHPTVPGRMVRYFEMTRDGFTLLAMGFTGEKATRFKVMYIERFNAMEEQLKRADPNDVFANPAKLRGVLLDYINRVEVAEGALERLAETEGEYTRKASAQLLQAPSEKFLTDWLVENRWIYRERGQANYVLYQGVRDKGWAVLKFEKIPTGMVVPVVYLTTRGLTEIAKALYHDEPAKLFPLLAVIQGQRTLIGRA